MLQIAVQLSKLPLAHQRMLRKLRISMTDARRSLVADRLAELRTVLNDLECASNYIRALGRHNAARAA